MLTFSNGILYEFTDYKEIRMVSSRILCYIIMGCDNILMKWVKEMKLFILVKLLQDDLEKKCMRYVYIYMLILDVVKSFHMVAGNGILYLEV